MLEGGYLMADIDRESYRRDIQNRLSGFDRDLDNWVRDQRMDANDPNINAIRNRRTDIDNRMRGMDTTADDRLEGIKHDVDNAWEGLKSDFKRLTSK